MPVYQIQFLRLSRFENASMTVWHYLAVRTAVPTETFSTAHRSNRPDSWDTSAVRQLSSLSGTVALQPGRVDRVRRGAVEDLVLSREDNQKGTNQLVRFRMKLAFPFTFAQLRLLTSQHISSSCASNDFVLSSCLKPIASPISRTDKHAYHLQ